LKWVAAVCESIPMTAAEPGASPSKTALRAAIDARLASLDSGNYRANNRVVLNAFAEYLEDHRGITDLEELAVIDCRRYAQHLRERVHEEDDGLSAASAHANGPYFTIVRAFLGWCVDDERIDTNPARPNRVKEALPEHHGDHDRQFWSAETREALLEFVDERAYATLEESADDRERAFRDRAIVTMLALTGARGAELFADPRDEHRNGLWWEDVDLERGLPSCSGRLANDSRSPSLIASLRVLSGTGRCLTPPPGIGRCFRLVTMLRSRGQPKRVSKPRGGALMISKRRWRPPRRWRSSVNTESRRQRSRRTERGRL
jgi:Site-specific recombinase XerD